ncbi:MAG: hypothetical protein DIU54_005040 [Acidobacteriota bacterium]|jgi:hypothetical protein|nr:MAG: hypothetical protein DIU54_04410 [Acidobacteriota bacterium]
MARRNAEEFEDVDPQLVYVARKLRHARRVELLLTDAGIDYAVETDVISTGFLFPVQRMGAFFYVARVDHDRARATLEREGFALVVAGEPEPD